MNGHKAAVRRVQAQPHAAPRILAADRADGAGLHASERAAAEWRALGLQHCAGCVLGAQV